MLYISNHHKEYQSFGHNADLHDAPPPYIGWLYRNKLYGALTRKVPGIYFHNSLCVLSLSIH